MTINLEKILNYPYINYTSDKVSGTKNLKRQSIEKLPILEGRIFQQNYPVLYALLQNCSIDISITREEENVNIPAMGQLDAMARYYEKKYGIKIRLCHITQVAALLEKLFQYQNLEPIGFILVNVDYGHVTPFLFHARKEKQELLIMDSCGIEGICSIPCEDLMSIPVPQMCRRMISKETRQADFGSCNAEGATLLRNALIHIKHLGDAFTSLESLIKPMHSKGNDLICQLPAQWIYIDQITSSITSDEWGQSCIKQLVSKEDPSTIRQVHDKWQDSLVSTITIKSIPENLVERIEALKSSDLDMKYENNTLTYRIEKSVNTYLAKKSQRSRFLK